MKFVYLYTHYFDGDIDETKVYADYYKAMDAVFTEFGKLMVSEIEANEDSSNYHNFERNETENSFELSWIYGDDKEHEYIRVEKVEVIE
jgi:hypothetical protein